jgi:hypothetical protein
VHRGQFELIALLAVMLLTFSASGMAAATSTQPTATLDMETVDIDSDSAQPLARTPPASGSIDNDSPEIDPQRLPLTEHEAPGIDAPCPNLVLINDEKVCRYASVFPAHTAAHR